MRALINYYFLYYFSQAVNSIRAPIFARGRLYIIYFYVFIFIFFNVFDMQSFPSGHASASRAGFILFFYFVLQAVIPIRARICIRRRPGVPFPLLALPTPGLSLCLSFSLSLSLSLSRARAPSLSLSVCLSIFLSVCVSVCVCLWLPTTVSGCWSRSRLAYHTLECVLLL